MNLHQFIDRYFIKQPRLREVVTRALYGSGECDVRLCGVELTIDRLRENGYLRASRKTRGSSLLAQEINVANVLSRISGSVDTFIDVGANVGFFSCLMARNGKLSPGFRTLAFEPHPDTFARLERNARRYGVEAYNLALGKADEQLVFVDGAVSHVFTDRAHANAYNIRSREITVECRRLDSIVADVGRCLVKIDTEGQELSVLEGAERLFTKGLIAAVYIDGHDGVEVPAFLRAHGFALLDVESLEPSDGSDFGLLALPAVGAWPVSGISADQRAPSRPPQAVVRTFTS